MESLTAALSEADERPAPPIAWSDARASVYSLCLKMLGRPHDAEDVAQEAMIRGWKSLGNWDASRPFLPWLMAIAANRCRTWMTSRRGKALGRGGDEVWEQIDHRIQPRNDLADVVEKILPSLKPEHRMAFELFHDQQLSLEEIAAKLERPIGTAKTWLHRARKQIVEQLRNEGMVEDCGTVDAPVQATQTPRMDARH